MNKERMLELAEDLRKRVDAATIEEQVAQLKAAGWLRINIRVWKAPAGGYFLGPHGAWLAMKRRSQESKP